MKLKIFIILVCAPYSVFAYTDPGTGMMLIQGLLLFIAMVIAFIKNPIASFKSLWKHYFGKEDEKEHKDINK